ncbi:hypothetical protein [Streptosporangium sandarakinum]
MTPEERFKAAIAGVPTPAFDHRHRPASYDERCGSCGAEIAEIDTGWGTNWEDRGGSGKCRRAANGLHWP